MELPDLARRAWRDTNAIVEDPELLREARAQINGNETSHVNAVQRSRNSSSSRNDFGR